jgi:acyl-CoA synthetase (AMP-forming)/AMP-acid ligase II
MLRLVPGSLDNPILAAWDGVLAARPEDPAILDAHGAKLETFSGIEAHAQAWAADFAGALAGRVVAVQIGNSVLLPGLLLALWRNRCIPVLLDRSMEGSSRENALETCQASTLITTPPSCRVDETAFQTEERAGHSPPAPADFLKLTSGTSSAPRAIRFTAAQLLADCDAVCDSMGITVSDLNYGVIPWSHSYGFSNLVTPLLCRGVPVVATEDRFPRAILNGLTASRATVFPAVPVFYQKLAELDGDRVPRLRLCISAGAPLAHSTAAAFRQRFGLKVHGFYGSSECGGIAYDASEADVPEGCVGAPMRGVDLRHDAATGRIEVRSAAVGLGYFPEPDPTVLGDGRFVPGDLLMQTSAGLVISGRVSDFINVSGRKLNPLEVEQVLRAIPGVQDAVVFGVPRAHRGEEPVACIVTDLNPFELQAACAAKLAPWQIPRDFWRVSALPVNERGKCSRRALAELYLQKPE